MGGCEAFIERVVAPNYDESCRNARKFIVDDALQHVLPPVRCRCGLEQRTCASRDALHQGGAVFRTKYVAVAATTCRLHGARVHVRVRLEA